MSSSEAFVTLATTDAYALGALVLAQSIRQVGTTRNLVVLISNHLSQLIKKSLETSFDEVIVVDELNSNDYEHLELLSRPELGITFTKINCWLLEQYTKCVFLDSDCLVLKPIDQLFEREQLSAAPDAGWPDCFNSGVFVYQPSKQTFRQLVAFASQQSSSFDGGDQGLLNSFFSDWRTADISRHLPFTYNVTANAFYSYLPAVTRFRNDIHIVHFAGALKPWQLTYNPQNQQLSGNLSGQNDIQRDFLLSWWNIMHLKVWPKIQLNQQNSNDESLQQNESLNGFGSSLNYGNLTNNQGFQLGSAAHRRAWESGQIDYFGRDSFSNIQQQLEKNIQLNSVPYHPAHSSQTTTTVDQQPTAQLKSALKQTNHNNHTSRLNEQPSLLTNQSKTPLQTPSNQVENRLQNKQVLTQSSHDTVIIQTTASSQLPTVKQTSLSSSQSSTSSQQQQQQQNIVKQSKVLNEQPTVTTVKQTVSQLSPSNTANLKTSANSNENKTPLTNEHQSNWTVKSTIVTTYTQGSGEHTGPTLVNKVVSQADASSSNKQISDSTNSNVVNKPLAKKTSENVYWLFDKVFIALTYTISLCYLLFLVAIGRKKNTNIIHGTGSTVHGVTTTTKTTTTTANSGNRKNK